MANRQQLVMNILSTWKGKGKQEKENLQACRWREEKKDEQLKLLTMLSKFDVQNSYFGGGYIFRIRFLKLLNNDGIIVKKFYNKLQTSCIGTC